MQTFDIIGWRLQILYKNKLLNQKRTFFIFLLLNGGNLTPEKCQDEFDMEVKEEEVRGDFTVYQKRISKIILQNLESNNK